MFAVEYNSTYGQAKKKKRLSPVNATHRTSEVKYHAVAELAWLDPHHGDLVAAAPGSGASCDRPRVPRF